MAKQPTIPFPQYAPDLTTLGTGVSSEISGVTPQADGYGPFQSLQDLTQALPDNCRGYFFARRSDGSIAVFAGTAQELYLLDNTTFAWVLVSQGGGPYSTLVTDDNWQFAQFNDLVIAVQVNTVPQKYVLSSGPTFIDLAGSPPQAAFIAIVNRFVVLSGLLSNSKRIQWSDLDGPEVWTAGVGLSDYQDLPDGGSVFGLSGGDAYGVAFQNESIRSLVYAPGSAFTFQINRISAQDTLYAKYSIINAGSRTFFCSAAGFKVIEAGGVPKPIGKERVDRYFFDNVDSNNLQLVIGATDPTSTRVFWAFKSKSGDAGLFDTVLIYDWSIGENGKWSKVLVSGQYIAALARPGLTLEQLDAIAPGAIAITDAVDNGAGEIRLTLNPGVTNGPFTIIGQNFINVQGVVGTTEANGQWVPTIIDPTHIDLNGSVFANAYISGGAIGGSLDALPFSLDSISKGAVASLSAVSSASMVGFFDGDNIEAIVETAETDLEGMTVFVEAVRPMTDAAEAVCSIGGRFTAQESFTFTTESAIEVDGTCPQEVETRYAKARLRIPAGAVWSYVRGVQPLAVEAGER